MAQHVMAMARAGIAAAGGQNAKDFVEATLVKVSAGAIGAPRLPRGAHS